MGWTVAGILMAALGFPSAAMLLLFTALTANACGAFADSCDNYGQTAPGFALFATAFVVVFLLACAGVILAIVSGSMRLVRRRRVRSEIG